MNHPAMIMIKKNVSIILFYIALLMSLFNVLLTLPLLQHLFFDVESYRTEDKTAYGFGYMAVILLQIFAIFVTVICSVISLILHKRRLWLALSPVVVIIGCFIIFLTGLFFASSQSNSINKSIEDAISKSIHYSIISTSQQPLSDRQFVLRFVIDQPHSYTVKLQNYQSDRFGNVSYDCASSKSYPQLFSPGTYEISYTCEIIYSSYQLQACRDNVCHHFPLTKTKP